MKRIIIIVFIVTNSLKVEAQEIKILTLQDMHYLIEEIEMMAEEDQRERSILGLGTLNDSILKLDNKLRETATMEEYIIFSNTIKKVLTKKQVDSLKQVQNQTDYRNYRRIKNIIKHFGYPSPERLGIDRDRVYPMLLHPPQSSFLKVEQYLEEMSALLKIEVFKNRMDGLLYATFHDNILSKVLQKNSLYGTTKTINSKTGKVSLGIIDDINLTNKKRREIGLPILKQGEYRESN